MAAMTHRGSSATTGGPARPAGDLGLDGGRCEGPRSEPRPSLARSGLVRLWRSALLGLGGLLLVSNAASAMTPEELSAWLQSGERVTVIDIRHPAQYAQNHVPGAINLPMPGLTQRQLPTMMNVVVVGDGFDVTAESGAIDALRAQGVPRVEVLDGGMMAWDESGASSVQQQGLVAGGPVMYVTSTQVERAVRSGRVGVVVVDMRADVAGRTPFSRTGLANLWVVEPPAAASNSQIVQHILRYRDQARGKVLLLVDDGDGRAEAVGMLLSAAGVKRQAILTGGERTLETWGQGAIETHLNGGAP